MSSHVIWKIETFIDEVTRWKKHCTQDKDASVPFKVGTLGPHTVLPIAISCPVIFSWISLMVWNLFLFKGDFKDFTYLFWERGREGEREGEKHQHAVASHTPPTGDLARNPGMCPDWESNLQLFGFAGWHSIHWATPARAVFNPIVILVKAPSVVTFTLFIHKTLY